MVRTSKVRLRVGVSLGLVVILALSSCGVKAAKDTDEYKTKVKVEATAKDDFITSEADLDKKVKDEATGEAIYPINLNQIGYRPNDRKVAVVSNNNGVDTYQVLDGSGNTVYSGKLKTQQWDKSSNSLVQYADFSMFTEPGSYVLVCGDNLFSDEFMIGEEIYQEYYSAFGRYFSDIQERIRLINGGKDSDTIKATIYGTEQEIDVSGGWYDLKERGQYVVDSCTTLSSMLMLYDSYNELDLEQSEIEELQPEVILSLVKEELQWLLKIQNSQGGVYHKVSVADSENPNGELYVFDVSTSATADFAAVMAKAYRYFEESDWQFANTCLEASQRAWYFLENNQDNIPFVNPKDVNTTEYTDDDDRDERFWAAIELSLTTKRSNYVSYVSKNIDTGFYLGFTWQKVAGYGIYNAIKDGQNIFSSSTYNRLNTMMSAKVESIKSKVDTETYQVYFDYAVNFQTVISEGLTLYLMGNYDKMVELCNHANVYLDYLMGANAYSENYVGEALKISSLDMDYTVKIALLLVGLNERY